VDFYPASGDSFAVQKDIIYTVNRMNIDILRMDRQGLLNKIGSLSLGQGIKDLEVDGEQLCLITNDGKLSFWKIHDSSTLLKLGEVEDMSFFDVIIVSKTVYGIVNTGEEFSEETGISFAVIDISNSAQPKILYLIPILEKYKKIKIANGKVYLFGRYYYPVSNREILIFQADPTWVKELGFVDIGREDKVDDIQIVGDDIYLGLSGMTAGLWVFHTTVPFVANNELEPLFWKSHVSKALLGLQIPYIFLFSSQGDEMGSAGKKVGVFNLNDRSEGKFSKELNFDEPIHEIDRIDNLMFFLDKNGLHTIEITP
jgi:hypothetical protein